MNTAQILALYDEEQRRTVEYTSLRREETPHIVRHVDLIGTDGVIVFSRLDESNADDAIREQIDYFEKLGQSFEWKHYDHDTPHDLKSRLAARGFELEEIEAIVALDLENIPPELARTQAHDVRRITDSQQLDEVIKVQEEVWQTDSKGQAIQLEYEMRNAPETISVYVAYDEAGQPISSAWIRFHLETSSFASLWAGSTLPAYRRRGVYTAMLAARAQEAIERGARFLTVDAGPMSRPILEKLGFQLLTMSTPCKWQVK